MLQRGPIRVVAEGHVMFKGVGLPNLETQSGIEAKTGTTYSCV